MTELQGWLFLAVLCFFYSRLPVETIIGRALNWFAFLAALGLVSTALSMLQDITILGWRISW